MKKLKVINKDPKNLIPYVNNAKMHSDEQITRLASSIHEFGFDQPIVVDKNLVIIKGHGRREAAIKLNLKQVPVVIADHLDEYQIKAARIADNKTSSNDYNNDFLKFDLGTLLNHDFNMAATGLPEFELESLLKDINQSIVYPEIIGDNTNTPETYNSQQNEPLIEDLKNYTKKIATPIYEPKGEKPILTDLIDLSKYQSLREEIEKSDFDKDEKEFLLFAATRHVVFNYEKIADYYSHSNKNVQKLFENSALVIIDFDKAIENGFVKLSKEINESYLNNEDLEENIQNQRFEI